MGVRRRIKRWLGFSSPPKNTNVVKEPQKTFIEEIPKNKKLSPEDIPELVLYGRDSCPYCLRVKQEVERMGIGHHIEVRDTSFGGPWRTDLAERTGRTQVPCLFIDGVAMFESQDIIIWLDQHIPY